MRRYLRSLAQFALLSVVLIACDSSGLMPDAQIDQASPQLRFGATVLYLPEADVLRPVAKIRSEFRIDEDQRAELLDGVLETDDLDDVLTAEEIGWLQFTDDSPGPGGSASMQPRRMRLGVGPSAPRFREVSFTGADGTAFVATLVEGAHDEGSPPRGVLISTEEGPIALSSYQYQMTAEGWTPTEARVVLIDEDGQPELVVQHSYDGSSPRVAARGHNGVASELVSTVQTAAAALEGFLGPQPLAGDMPAQENECMSYDAGLLLALAAEVAALASLSQAIAACAFTAGVCAAVVAATALAAAATAAVVVASRLLDDCYQGYWNDPTSGGSHESMGIGTYSDGCYEIDWYVSYDDGLTWIFIGTTIQC